MLAVMVFSFGFGWKVASPILRLDRAIKSFNGESTHLKLPVERSDEIGRIARSFSSLSEQLRDTQAAERRAYQKLSAIFDQSIDSLITFNSNGEIESVNRAAKQMFGYDDEELIGENIRIIMPEPYRKYHRQLFENLRASGEASIIGKTREIRVLIMIGDVIDLE